MFWAGFEPATAAPVWGNVQASECPEPCWYNGNKKKKNKKKSKDALTCF